MKISKQARRDGKSLFRCCLEGGQLNEQRVRSVVSAVLEKKPRGYLAVLHQFSRLVSLEVKRRTATIESASALDADQKARIQERLTANYGAGLTFNFSENPNLIGGLRVQVGSDVFDGSVRSRLDGLSASFAAA